MWSQTYGGTSVEWARSFVETSDGGYAILGITSSFGAGQADAWLIKTDAFGNMQWNKTYGGEWWDYTYSLAVTPDGGYAIAGETNSFGAGEDDAWLIKTDAFGNMQWNRTYGGEYWDGAYSLVLTSDGGYAMAGYTRSFGTESTDFWLIKTDSFGNLEWNKTYSGMAGRNFRARSLVSTFDGGYALAGGDHQPTIGSNTDCWLVKTDASGNMEWNRTYGGPGTDTANSLVVTPDGGYAIAGRWNHTMTFQTGEPQAFVTTGDFWLVKTDELGNMEWNRTYGGTGEETANSLVVTSDGGYALAGTFNYTWYEEIGNPETAVFAGECWLVKTDALGNMEWNMTYGVEGIDEGYSLVKTSDGGYAMAGYTGWRHDFPCDCWLIKTDEFGIVPEYTSWLIPALVLTATAFIIVNKKLRGARRSEKRRRELNLRYMVIS